MSLSVKMINVIFLRPLSMHASRSPYCLQKRHPHAPIKSLGERKASYTVEAAVIMPIFLYICVVILMFFGVEKNEWITKAAISDAARKLAIYSSVDEDIGTDIGVLSIDDKDVTVNAVYPVRMPMDFFGLGGMTVAQTAKAHRWVGYDPHEDETAAGDEVYVTETGSAYHISLECKYLDLSIRAVSSEAVTSERNSSGGKYTACPICGGEGTMVYITDYGKRYHSDLACSGLKRTIRTESREKAISEGYHACSKCAR